MPTLPYLTDTSTQLTGTYTASTTALDNFTTSNYVIGTSNTLQTKINLKQDTLTAATNLLGVGSAITALDYTKITLNKPTDFQANWNTTVINKPSVFPADMTNIYSKTETNNLLSAKEANLTFSSPLTRTTNTIGINLSSYSTTGNDASYLLKTGGTMTGALINTSTTASDFKGIYIMHTARQTHIPYLPNGQFYFRAPVNIDNENDYLSFGSRIGDNFLRLYGADFGFGINSGTLRYNVPMGSVHRFYHGTTNTAWINDAGRLKATTFEGSGSALTDVPYTALTGTAPFYTKTETNTLITNTSNYASNVSNVIITNVNNNYLKLAGGTMAANANITLSGTGTFTGIHSGNGAALTNLPLSAYSTTGNDSSYVLKTGSTMTGLLSGTTINTTGNIGIGITNPPAPLSIGTPDVLGSDGFIFIGKYKASVGNRCFKIGYDDGFNMCFGDFGATISATSWTPNQFNINWNTGNVGIGTSGQSQRLNVNGTTYFNGNSTVIGTLTATTFSGSGASLTNLPLSAYSTTGNDASYVLKTGSTMTGNLTVNANLYLKNGTWHQSMDNVFRLWFDNNGPTYYSCGATTDNHIFYNSLYATTFKIMSNGNIQATGSISEGGTLLTSKYLQLTGGNMTGTINLLPTTAITPLYIYSTAAASINNIELKNNANNSCYIGIGGTSYTGYYINNLFLQSPNSLILNTGGTGTGSTPKMIINNSGNVGIATTNPTELLNLYSIGTNNAFIKADAGGGTGQSGLRLFAGSGATNRATRIDFFNNVASTTSARWSILNDTDQNGTNDFRIYNAGGITNVFTILQNGNVGIATTNPNNILQVGDGARLRISNGVNDYSVIGTKNVDDTTNTRIVISGNTRGSFEGRIEYLSTAGDHIFYTNATNERMRISNNGTVNIVNTLQIAGNNINNFIYNNTGRNHSTYTDFNAIDKFGYTFIQGSANGPGGDSQYYSWYIGLGNEYPVVNSVNGYYGMQFALGRFNANPKLSVRRKEGNNAVWTGWQGITAEKAESLTSGNKTISGNLDITGALSIGTTANISGLTRLRHIFNYGETLSYVVGYNGGSASGWFWTTNGFWSGYGTGSYLNVAITCTGIFGVYWYGRAFLSGAGGCYAVITDFRTPDNNNGNQISVQEYWGPNGANALRISILNISYAGNFNIKISG
jgi:hypothetical protein